MVIASISGFWRNPSFKNSILFYFKNVIAVPGKKNLQHLDYFFLLHVRLLSYFEQLCVDKALPTES